MLVTGSMSCHVHVDSFWPVDSGKVDWMLTNTVCPLLLVSLIHALSGSCGGQDKVRPAGPGQCLASRVSPEALKNAIVPVS